MPRFMDLKDLGEAAPYLRLSNLEQMAAKAQAFDGTKTHLKPYSDDSNEH